MTGSSNGCRRNVPPAPVGLELAVTGSAVVGHDTNKAAGESIQNTTNSTIILVVLILLVVYRSPLLAMVPLVTIALSVFVSLRLIALLTRVPGLGFQVISITRVFIVVVLFGAGTDYCLFLIARYCEELGRGRPRVDALREAIRQVGTALVASAGTVIVGLGMLYLLEFRQGQIHRSDDRAQFVRGAARRTHAGARDVGRTARGDFLAFPCPTTGGRCRSRARRIGGSSNDGLLGSGRRPRGRLSPLDPLGMPAGARAPGRGRGPHQIEPQPVERPRPRSS